MLAPGALPVCSYIPQATAKVVAGLSALLADLPAGLAGEALELRDQGRCFAFVPGQTSKRQTAPVFLVKEEIHCGGFAHVPGGPVGSYNRVYHAQ